MENVEWVVKSSLKYKEIYIQNTTDFTITSLTEKSIYITEKAQGNFKIFKAVIFYSLYNWYFIGHITRDMAG